MFQLNRYMENQQQLDYRRIAKAIDYIHKNFKHQPSLDELANEVHLSPFHFQRLFTNWAGTTPKRFLQYISLQHAKKLLEDESTTLSETTHELGLSSTSRLHDLFIRMEGMTPGEYRDGGSKLKINFSFAESPFGNIIIASTPKGICYLSFEDDEQKAFEDLEGMFPNASYQQKLDLIQQNALFIFQHDWSKLSQIKLHLKGTDFQLKVWEGLLKIPMGKLSTYGKIGKAIGKPNASRAIGTAIGSNPIAYLIPCHRVIRATGHLGGYRWNPTRKSAIIGWECSKLQGSS